MPTDQEASMAWVSALNAVGLVLAVTIVAETFRSEPRWPRPERSPSPTQRRWLGVSLALISTSGLLSTTVPTDSRPTVVWMLAGILPVLGIVAVVLSVRKRPTDQELERRARLVRDERN